MEEIIDKPYVIGLDMGGTNSVFGIVDQRGTILAQTVIATKDYPDINDYVAAAVKALQPALDVVGGIDNIRAWASVRQVAISIMAPSNVLLTSFGKEKFPFATSLKKHLASLFA